MLRRSLLRRLYISAEQVLHVVEAKQKQHPSTLRTLLVDVRSTGEVARTGLIPTAINIPLPLLETALNSEEISQEEFQETFGAPQPSPENSTLIFYCAFGVRSETAVSIAEELGFKSAYNFTGSWAQWQYMHSVGKGMDSVDSEVREADQTPDRQLNPSTSQNEQRE